ncbi:MAG: endolytic transglycosylase MltG [Elusimicrobiaceae bacterium]|nr:endolytic transglycosylase MltG [Elusimicrobiaceae bacterium]
MKKFIILSVLLLACIAAGIWAAKVYFFSKGPLVMVQIRPGQTGNEVARLLKAKGVIRSELLFKILFRLTADKNDLKAGRFDLRRNTPDLEVISCIKTGQCTHYEKVTILEGWRSEEIASELGAHGVTDPQAFLNIVREKDLEGHLFPSTYLFSDSTSAQKVVDQMLAQYDKNIAPLFKKYKTDLTERQVLTLASIVEREALVHDERPKIAAVYLNRFRIGKRLEADPTVQYALGFTLKENRFWKKGLTFKDLRVDSPYNTYRNAGLPPGPICNPGAKSVEAVLNPQPDFNAIYFVADRTGRHAFSRTFEEHKNNIKRIRGR